jgi:hypothetical protein
VTRAQDPRPTVRVTQSKSGELVVELTARTLRIRPLRTRRGGPAEVEIPVGAVYIQAMARRAEERRRARAKSRRR